jgi:hypothetical protein
MFNAGNAGNEIAPDSAFPATWNRGSEAGVHGVAGVKKVEAGWTLAQPASFCGVSRILSRRSLLEETARMTICLTSYL